MWLSWILRNWLLPGGLTGAGMNLLPICFHLLLSEFYLFFLLPFWCRRREALAKAERKYMALNEAGRCTHCALKLRLFPHKAALRLVAPGGILLTCALGICDKSCSEIPCHFDRKDTRCAGKKKEATLGLVI